MPPHSGGIRRHKRPILPLCSLDVVKFSVLRFNLPDNAFARIKMDDLKFVLIKNDTDCQQG